jgi:hypothetical protein
MEAIRSSETSVQSTRSTRRHIPEDGILHSHRHENLKSYIKHFMFFQNRHYAFISEFPRRILVLNYIHIFPLSLTQITGSILYIYGVQWLLSVYILGSFSLLLACSRIMLFDRISRLTLNLDFLTAYFHELCSVFNRSDGRLCL